MATKVIVPVRSAVRPVYEEGKHVSDEIVQYEACLDMDALDTMSRRAAQSKGQKAQDGPITVKVLNRSRIPTPAQIIAAEEKR